jgi:hypothetical protein
MGRLCDAEVRVGCAWPKTGRVSRRVARSHGISLLTMHPVNLTAFFQTTSNWFVLVELVGQPVRSVEGNV